MAINLDSIASHSLLAPRGFADWTLAPALEFPKKIAADFVPELTATSKPLGRYC
jgi:hypothetical protein